MFLRHLEALGPLRLGKLHTLVVHGPSFRAYVLRQSLATAMIPLGSAGWFLPDPAQILGEQSGKLNRDGKALVTTLVPLDLGLIGTTTYWQAFVGSPAHGTNLATTTVVGF